MDWAPVIIVVIFFMIEGLLIITELPVIMRDSNHSRVSLFLFLFL